MRVFQTIKELLDQLSRSDDDDEMKRLFKNELTLAIRDIRAEYESMADLNQPDSENWYRGKVTYAHLLFCVQGILYQLCAATLETEMQSN